jgi:hypothetical protein
MMSPDHHTVWANTAALTAAGLLHGAEMPPGHFVVMGDDGTATGELREFDAFVPVLALGGEAHLQLGIATGGEPTPWPDAAMRARKACRSIRAESFTTVRVAPIVPNLPDCVSVVATRGTSVYATLRICPMTRRRTRATCSRLARSAGRSVSP